MATKLLLGTAHSAAGSLKTFRGLVSLLLVLVAYVSLIQAAKPTLHAEPASDSNEVVLTCRNEGTVVVQDAKFNFGEPIFSVMTGDGNSLTVVVAPENETEVRCRETGGEESDILYLFAPRQDTAPSPSCPVYDDGNTFLEFNCEFEPGRMRQHYLLIWREIPISGGSRIVSGSGLTGFSADTDDFSLRVDLSVVKDIGSFFCRVEVPKCVESLSSPDNISGSCAKSILPGMEQKVPPNYSNLLSAQPLIPTSAMEGVPVNISCTANTTGFQDITFEWTVGQGLPILCSNNSNCSTEGGVSVLRREYSEGQINVSCTVHANDSTGTGGCVKTTRRSSLTVEAPPSSTTSVMPSPTPTATIITTGGGIMPTEAPLPVTYLVIICVLGGLILLIILAAILLAAAIIICRYMYKSRKITRPLPSRLPRSLHRFISGDYPGTYKYDPSGPRVYTPIDEERPFEFEVEGTEPRHPFPHQQAEIDVQSDGEGGRSVNTTMTNASYTPNSLQRIQMLGIPGGSPGMVRNPSVSSCESHRTPSHTGSVLDVPGGTHHSSKNSLDGHVHHSRTGSQGSRVGSQCSCGRPRSRSVSPAKLDIAEPFQQTFRGAPFPNSADMTSSPSSSSSSASPPLNRPVSQEIVQSVLASLLHNEDCLIPRCTCHEAKRKLAVMMGIKPQHSGDEPHSSDTSSSSSSLSDRRKKMRLPLKYKFSKRIPSRAHQAHIHHHLTTKSHMIHTPGYRSHASNFQRRRSKSVDLTPISESPMKLAEDPTLQSPIFLPSHNPPTTSDDSTDAADGVCSDPEPEPGFQRQFLLREISISADNIPAVCVNDCPLTPTPLRFEDRSLAATALSPVRQQRSSWIRRPTLEGIPEQRRMSGLLQSRKQEDQTQKQLSGGSSDTDMSTTSSHEDSQAGTAASEPTETKPTGAEPTRPKLSRQPELSQSDLSQPEDTPLPRLDVAQSWYRNGTSHSGESDTDPGSDSGHRNGTMPGIDPRRGEHAATSSLKPAANRNPLKHSLEHIVHAHTVPLPTSERRRSHELPPTSDPAQIWAHPAPSWSRPASNASLTAVPPAPSWRRPASNGSLNVAPPGQTWAASNDSLAAPAADRTWTASNGSLTVTESLC